MTPEAITPSATAAPAFNEPEPGRLTRLKTKKLGVTIYRQKFVDRHGKVQYARGWHYKKMVLGQWGSFPLGVNQRTAEKLAEQIESFLSIPSNTLQKALETYNPRALKRAEHIATIGDCLKVFEGALSHIGHRGKSVSPSTFNGYRKRLFILLRKVEAHRKGVEFKGWKGCKNIDYSPWEKLSTAFLTTRAVMDFKQASMPPPPEGEEEPDEEAVLVAKISADSTLTCARAIFGKQALKVYHEMGLKLADITGFMTEPDFGATRYFQILPPEVIVPIMRASLELRIADVDAYRAFILAMHCGLRAGEVKGFAASWIRQDDKPMLYVHVRGKFNPKHGTGRRVTLEPWVAETIRELGPVQDPAALKRLSDWMRGFIPKEYRVEKPIHEMRKCWTSAKSKTGGIFEAVKEAGHKDIQTTATCYADNQMADWLTPLWTERTDVAMKLPKFAAL